MSSRILSSAGATVVLLVAIFCGFFFCGCAVPLAPGYQIQKETLTVHFIAANSPHLAVRAEYRLANIGNAPLHFFDATLPGDKSFDRANLHAQINGQEVQLQRAPAEQNPADSSASVWRVSLPSAWRQKEKITLALSYDLAAQPATDPRIFVSANTFYVNDSGWFPQLHGFRGLFAASPTRPDPTTLSVIIPADFRVTASGQPRGTKKQAAEVAHQFLIRKADFDPYVLAGQYNEQRISANGIAVAIWTFKPIAAEQAQKTAAQIATAEKFYLQNFGPLPKSMKAFYDVELPIDLSNANWKQWQDLLLPGLVYDWALQPGKTFRAGLNNALSSLVGPTLLGNTWFGHLVRPHAEAWMLSFVFDVYGAYSPSENSDESSRAETIRSALEDYDNERAQAVEKPVLSLTPNDPHDQLSLGIDKMTFFFAALEDKCGRQNVTHAIHDMVYALRGEQYGYSDFRAALEQQCHQNLADFFRTWLAQPGIPPDFRARYSNAGADKQ